MSRASWTAQRKRVLALPLFGACVFVLSNDPAAIAGHRSTTGDDDLPSISQRYDPLVVALNGTRGAYLRGDFEVARSWFAFAAVLLENATPAERSSRQWPRSNADQLLVMLQMYDWYARGQHPELDAQHDALRRLALRHRRPESIGGEAGPDRHARRPLRSLLAARARDGRPSRRLRPVHLADHPDRPPPHPLRSLHPHAAEHRRHRDPLRSPRSLSGHDRRRPDSVAPADQRCNLLAGGQYRPCRLRASCIAGMFQAQHLVQPGCRIPMPGPNGRHHGGISGSQAHHTTVPRAPRSGCIALHDPCSFRDGPILARSRSVPMKRTSIRRVVMIPVAIALGCMMSRGTASSAAPEDASPTPPQTSVRDAAQVAPPVARLDSAEIYYAWGDFGSVVRVLARQTHARPRASLLLGWSLVPARPDAGSGGRFRARARNGAREPRSHSMATRSRSIERISRSARRPSSGASWRPTPIARRAFAGSQPCSTPRNVSKNACRSRTGCCGVIREIRRRSTTW